MKEYHFVLNMLRVFDWFKSNYNRQEREVKERLLESVNRTFKDMYHGDRKVILDEITTLSC